MLLVAHRDRAVKRLFNPFSGPLVADDLVPSFVGCRVEARHGDIYEQLAWRQISRQEAQESSAKLPQMKPLGQQHSMPCWAT